MLFTCQFSEHLDSAVECLIRSRKANTKVRVFLAENVTGDNQQIVFELLLGG